MKKNFLKSLTIVSVFLSSNSLFAQVTQEWATLYDHENHGSASAEMVVDDSGYVYVAGTTTDSVYSNGDFLTVKYSPSGSIIWAKTYGVNTESDIGLSLCLDKPGNIYVSGDIYLGLIADSGSTIKYDNAGNPQWVFNIDEYSIDNACDTAGNIYVLSQYGGGQAIITKLSSNDSIFWNTISDSIQPQSFLLDKGGNIFLLGNNNSVNNEVQYAIRKYNNQGQFVWEADYNPSSGIDLAESMVIDDSSNVYVTGLVNLPSQDGMGTVKFDSSGNYKWDQIFNPLAKGWGKSIAVDSLGYTYVAGTVFDGNFDGYYLVKYDEGGNQIWALPYDTANGNEFIKMIIHDNSLYMTYRKKTGVSLSNIVTLKLDTAGSEKWRMEYAGPGSNCYPVDIKCDNQNNVYLTGYRFGGIVTIKYSQTTGIEEFSSALNNILVYPNPSSSFIKIECKHLINNISVFDYTGRLIDDYKNINSNNFIINSMNWKEGLYVIKTDEKFYKELIIH